ncbi:hypothetical protein [Ornithinimicrobium cerasi]|uniref:Uncharacterized protein n=1 Tax=Ornithinimicrobium cerasi TaxID=2248773 RepID=A0A285VJR3_9MICO|nr:hypothetical protein [Ornithinimicrobium cerasi]SOC54309.1 hypothetical protein SAMN05421879_10360 [Ornithinimicrobium cerasi]
MTPLKLVVLGILVVALDLDVGTVDLLLDPVGYGLVVLGVHRIAHLHASLPWARAAAGVGLVASVLALLLRRLETVVTGEGGGITTTTQRLVEHPVPGAVEALAQGAFVIALCTALIALATSDRVRAPSRLLRWALPGADLLAVLLALVLTTTEVDGPVPVEGVVAASVLTALTLLLVVVTLALALWFVVVLVRASREPTLSGDRPPVMIAG